MASLNLYRMWRNINIYSITNNDRTIPKFVCIYDINNFFLSRALTLHLANGKCALNAASQQQMLMMTRECNALHFTNIFNI